jgi:uncharacterized protein
VINVYTLAIETFTPMLNTLSMLLDKGAAHASAQGSDPNTLVGARLAADMYPLSTQVQLACHHPRDAMARLTGSTPPKFDNTELTFEDLKILIERTVAHLKSLSPESFDGADDRKIEIPLVDRLVFEANGFELLRDWSIPHFYFHVVTAYDILRHNGVAIGKRDYMNHIGPHIRQRSD